MLNRDPLTQPGAAGRGELPLAELGQQVLVGVVLDAALPRTGRATLPERAGGTDLGGELDLAAQGVNGMVTPLGQPSRPMAKSSVNAALPNR